MGRASPRNFRAFFTQSLPHLFKTSYAKPRLERPSAARLLNTPDKPEGTDTPDSTEAEAVVAAAAAV